MQVKYQGSIPTHTQKKILKNLPNTYYNLYSHQLKKTSYKTPFFVTLGAHNKMNEMRQFR